MRSKRSSDLLPFLLCLLALLGPDLLPADEPVAIGATPGAVAGSPTPGIASGKLSQGASNPVQIKAVGEAAPFCTLEELRGTKVSFPIKGEWNLIFYWSLFCHSCLEEIPMVVEDLKAYPPPGPKTFFISLDTAQRRTALENYMKKRSLDFTLLLEEISSGTYKSADLWGVKTTPSVFLVDPSGMVRFSREGPFDLAEALDLLRKSSSPPVPLASGPESEGGKP